MKDKPRLLILSTVYPFPRNAGQQQRVYYKLRALRADFHLTFLTVAVLNQMVEVRQRLLELCDDAIVLPSRYRHNFFSQMFHKIIGTLYAAFTGLKFSNYLTGEVEFPPERIKQVIRESSFEAVLFEYWHAFKTVHIFRERGIPSILDMHDILWRSYARQLCAEKSLPDWIKNSWIKRYRSREEAAWRNFGMLIAINQDECDYARCQVGDVTKFFYVPMGTDISEWLYSWEPANPMRIAYYGGLGSSHNQHDALLCYREIMPIIWKNIPEAEFWIIGSNPPRFIRNLTRDNRVKVTGFVAHVQDVLKTMTLVLCPWSGTYGFRSRVVEVMSLGVPIVASSDAVQGMGFEIGRGIFVGETSAEMASLGLKLIENDTELKRQSRLARQQMEEKFSYETTYVKFSKELATSLRYHY